MYVYMYVCVCVCVYIYIYIHAKHQVVTAILKIYFADLHKISTLNHEIFDHTMKCASFVSNRNIGFPNRRKKKRNTSTKAEGKRKLFQHKE